MLKQHLHAFQVPEKTYAPYPFWFINDTLDEAELTRQIDDFHEKGLAGFVLHPRIGLPRDIPYLSDEFMRMITVCVRRAKEHGMHVILYDEGMYPSGSCHGQVVAANPAYAARSLVCRKTDELRLAEHEFIVGQFGVKPLADGAYAYLPDRADYTLVCSFTGGTIRGIHDDEDDGMANPPKAADLLNREAMALFIHLTHDRYYEYTHEYFGNTVMGFFTDEPSVTGRAVKRGTIPWTKELLPEYTALTDAPLAALFFDMGEASRNAKQALEDAVHARLSRVYYRQIADWCKAHGIHLMGHPAESDETAAQIFFGVPGQDLIGRYVAPERNLESPHSVMGKNSADMARQLGAQRNSNEVLGVCGNKQNQWDFTCTEMMWYYNWLLARGVNLLIPHAFYYSVRTPLHFGERPPDVGPNNVFWPQFRRISEYLARLCWLNTDSVNHPACAVLCENQTMPHLPVNALYENGIDFNYVNAQLFEKQARLENGKLIIGAYAYDTVLCEPSFRMSQALKSLLDAFAAQGGKFCRTDDFYGFLTANKAFENAFIGENTEYLRRVHLTKDGVEYHLLFNECDTAEKTITGTLKIGKTGKLMRLNPYSGEALPCPAEEKDGKLFVAITLEAYECLILAVDPTQAFAPAPKNKPLFEEIPLTLTLDRADTFGTTEPVYAAGVFTLSEIPKGAKIMLRCGQIYEKASVTVNDRFAGDLIFKPFRLDITDLCRAGENAIELTCLPSPCNTFGKPKDCGVWDVGICIYK